MENVTLLRQKEQDIGGLLPLRLNGAVYKSYVRPAILYGREALCLKERLEFYEGQRDEW